jgi:hypothetical protein
MEQPMTSTDHGARSLRRSTPPVHASTLVRSDRAHTFDAFVRTIGTWWPVTPFSAGRDRVREITVEPRVGGTVYETWDDGTTARWGEMRAWDPPSGFTMTWDGTPVPTEVELQFVYLAPTLTRVTVEHRGWEALSDEQLAEDCALPRGYDGGGYDIGWNEILDRFARAVDRPDWTDLPTISDDFMLTSLQDRTRTYTLMMLKRGPHWDVPERDRIIWEHGRRNFALRENGVLAIVCPIPDDSPWCGIGVFDAPEDEVDVIMQRDPGVHAGVFDYELHPVRSFRGDRLPS